MALVNFQYSFVLLVFIAILVIPSKCYGESQKPRSRSALFVFGDSLFDPGNNQYTNGSGPSSSSNWPYGETYFKHPTGRICDGRIVPDFIALFAKLPILPPYLQPGEHNFTDGSNFASGGAGVLDSTHPGTINLNMQLRYFKNVDKWLRQKVGDVEAKKVLTRAVYLFSIGGNDYFSLSMENPNATASFQKEYVEMVIGNLTNVLKEVYRMGGRKIAFQNAGPLGCVPGTKAMKPSVGGNCDELPSALARRHNRILSITLKRLESQLPGFKYSIFDYYNSLYDMVFNPSKYGFKEGKAACCGSGPYRGKNCGGNNGTTDYELCSNPNEYVWFDGAHTTEGANWQLGKLLWEGSPKVTGPYNLKQLFKHVK
ncbi:GDSL esterase/lipase 1-like [Cornus florida]|uniref:GDSL esterase/lipase 1-like n=1 Tax=Cornus florida TaxID=4283 RepID=UPI0028A05227|nr:GDSL esterase/lipase 1-like [Cornus florida]